MFNYVDVVQARHLLTVGRLNFFALLYLMYNGQPQLEQTSVYYIDGYVALFLLFLHCK
ncbi:hypothetical protein BT96DRAFT_158021 [Gymnopus androsaceus JB14]|uniref:Uncharacterized protein n=1 Tax=Gymnopus androsaceus JB14 TaxID=1447944 RepID=A0A6A4HBN8_9AGAR|nr:hypothetical protein BT96DRAFT_158021 [Gymnopus androsaceus JB14]